MATQYLARIQTQQTIQERECINPMGNYLDELSVRISNIKWKLTYIVGVVIPITIQITKSRCIFCLNSKLMRCECVVHIMSCEKLAVHKLRHAVLEIWRPPSLLVTQKVSKVKQICKDCHLFLNTRFHITAWRHLWTIPYIKYHKMSYLKCHNVHRLAQPGMVM